MSLECTILQIGTLLVNETATGFSQIGDIIDYAYKVSMVIIAGINIYLVVYYHAKGDLKDKKTKDKDRKVLMLKTLILDHNLDKFYTSCDKIETSLSKLHNQNCDKRALEKELQEGFYQLFNKFINFLSAIDDNLYNSLKESCDKCRDTLVKNIGDEGVNLNVNKKYEELIQSVLDKNKTEMLAILFKYDGGE